MAVTQNSYTQQNNSTVAYPFTFPYLKASDIKVSLDAVATTAFTLANATTVQLNSVPPVGTKIKIFRETGIDSLSATFYAGSAIKSEDLNDNFTQNLYVTQEVNGRYISALGGTMVGNFNLGEDADIVFEGATDNNNETILTVADPSQDNTITLPDVSGTVITTGDTGTISTNMLGDDSVSMAKLDSGALPTDITVASANIVDGTIVNVDVNSAAAIEGTKISPDFGSQNIVTTGTAATGAHTVTGNITVSGTVDGRDLQVDGTKLDGIETGATADQTAAEIRTLVGNATDSNVFTDANLTKLNGIETGATADQTASDIKTLIASSPLDDSHLAPNSVTTSEIADAELTTLAGMRPATASILASGTDLTAEIADINQIDGMAKETSITDDDTKFPTSGAVVDYVAAQIAPLGGLEVIATDAAFPNTQPSAGVVISISDAGGVVFNGSGTSTTARTVGGSTVTINNAPSSLNSETLAAGVGLMVSSTGSGQIYNYHKILGKEDDIKQLSDDINDFNARYRVGSSNPTTALDSGDLFFNTGTGKLLVYNGTNSAWEEAQSVGNFFISTLSPAFDGSRQDFTLSDAPTNAQQIILSINGVVQKPNAGTSTPSEGFALDGSTVKLAAAPASSDTYFAIVMGSTVNIGTPSNNTVSTAIIQNGAVTGEKISTNLDLDDNKKIRFGTGNDLEIFHDGNQSVIKDSGTGQLLISGENTIALTNASATENYARFLKDGAAELYHNNVKRIETTATGVDVTGNLNLDDNSKLQLGDSQDLQIYHTGSVSNIQDNTGANLDLCGNRVNLVRGDKNTQMLAAIANGPVEIYYSNSKKFETTSTGATITGELKVSTPFLEMPQTISANKTITNNHNCLTVGPVTINSGVTVTVGDGENWVIV